MFTFVVQLNNASNLLSLGSLIGGLPSEKLAAIPPQQILQTSHDPVFVKNILAAPDIVQITYVYQVLSARFMCIFSVTECNSFIVSVH